MKRNEIAKIILASIAVTGGVFVFAALPGLAEAFAPYLKKQRYLNSGQLKKSLNKLAIGGFVGITQDGNKTVLKLTKAGMQKVLTFKLDDMQIKRQKRWDRKWRIVMFDIPEKFKQKRDALVQKLGEIGFIRIQKSVWICPFPCEDEIFFIAELYEVREYLRMITAEDIDREENLLKAFNLR
ncbi:MAG: hypothetical protein A3I07_00200 [Candidatus Doudnabacteria bacterium RIFCSPLOWO2_02_FULL_42_9]|uniref:Transcriptional repressor PaaX-like central Cas2-like domain-containing protein n=1 Tax=Candidatus Doudnabacteria bacterium RIFCSPHIGHO2_01_FULL_41_86 TaxID=1817821 RepID=A0A1F5N924_9BACT|nr:MAG: hypothetical protein A2717_01085 [Candidatus Doudnabacteria bacterium RIFCSPHIGHO2_01_FULL_41_86]OGE75218.1 MAG: hypothetical protein A3K07_00095 [Candidatus Doudnabacteria bacterium RIFCSPHIGHO2_01_43_10]OGE85167.1 MAG: hypothetical protein A3E28_00650 [Candidatus Doudnabacteria bacterium RIFCSPHIGHO2_12_FULL_42_22]OGE86705.1 MAG: hypothetical protein A3C49_01485 [Candidatus Doudnabacteria bacterium RIFCSPHIGHO2_02_FULL_42_25]OGE92303.1 MAG: hypothetical protein A2895_01640 [Candidatus